METKLKQKQTQYFILFICSDIKFIFFLFRNESPKITTKVFLILEKILQINWNGVGWTEESLETTRAFLNFIV